ncbi:hypothetical protein SPBR_07499 [Sporothrix brasiliensis 5110]|uniref:Methyltransferase domain-containing protein n=1 Tax=Sporothrix brasiliensis 5110 TaxID=1398154 RepID=A0A0C2FEM0_9PEZI|nr:uncharacterized protein SPBR_07499 [Sporothrix brasiliensis 5110]KIH89578.1 hypothetical protein SPBR_07499 [Sporothrix brasiliensis 5110]
MVTSKPIFDMVSASTGEAVPAAAPHDAAADEATARPQAPLIAAERVELWKKHSYFETLPEDIAHMRRLLRDYSHMPADAIDAHLYAVRDKLWSVYQYPCIGRFAFLSLGITKSPYYQEAVTRLTLTSAALNHERLLDLGCCVGQVLRQMAHDGVDPHKLSGADLHSEFIDLGYEMFGDGAGESGEAGANGFTFVAGDILTDRPSPLDALTQSVTMVHAANFFHLFSWDDQVKAAVRIVQFLSDAHTSSDTSTGSTDEKPTGISVFGAQLAHRFPGEHRIVPHSPRTRYLHDATTFQKLWDEVGAATGTRWRTAMVPTASGIGAALTGSPDVMGDEGGDKVQV